MKAEDPAKIGEQVTDYCKRIKNLEELTEEQIKKELEFLLNTPMTSKGYLLAYHGLLALKEKVGIDSVRESAYEKVIKMLEEEPDLSDPEAIRLQTNYATAILSNFIEPSVPEKYASRIIAAAKKHIQKTGKEDDLIKEFILDKL